MTSKVFSSIGCRPGVSGLHSAGFGGSGHADMAGFVSAPSVTQYLTCAPSPPSGRLTSDISGICVRGRRSSDHLPSSSAPLTISALMLPRPDPVDFPVCLVHCLPSPECFRDQRCIYRCNTVRGRCPLDRIGTNDPTTGCRTGKDEERPRKSLMVETENAPYQGFGMHRARLLSPQ